MVTSAMPSMNNKDFNFNMQMDRMAQYIEVMKLRVDNWKHLIEDQIDERKSDLSKKWQNFLSDKENQILVHYTARCKYLHHQYN